MPDSDRGRLFTAVTAFFVATVVILTGLAIWDGAASYTQHRLEAEHYAAEYASESQERIEQCAALADSADITECISQVVEATREHQRGERDLAAQRDMAKWAGWLLVASGVTVLIGIAGVVYVRHTLMETRRIGQAQVRAYLSCKSFTLHAAPGEGVWLYPEIFNSGQSPAENSRFSAYIETLVSRNGKSFYSKSKTSDGDGPYVAASDTGMMYIAWSKGDFSPEAYQALISGSARFDLFCTLYCTDVFGTERQTTFLITVGAPNRAADGIRAVYNTGSIDHLPPGVYA